MIRDELKAGENCLTPDSSFTRNLQDSYKGGKKFNSTYTGAGLHISQEARKIVCVFCQDKHWSDKCQVVTDPLSRREFLKKSGKCFLYLKDNHQVKNCKKSINLATIVKDYIILRFVFKRIKKAIPLN